MFKSDISLFIKPLKSKTYRSTHGIIFRSFFLLYSWYWANEVDPMYSVSCCFAPFGGYWATFYRINDGLWGWSRPRSQRWWRQWAKRIGPRCIPVRQTSCLCCLRWRIASSLGFNANAVPILPSPIIHTFFGYKLKKNKMHNAIHDCQNVLKTFKKIKFIL